MDLMNSIVASINFDEKQYIRSQSSEGNERLDLKSLIRLLPFPDKTTAIEEEAILQERPNN